MRKTTLITLIVGAVLVLVLAACGGQQAEKTTQAEPPAATQEVNKDAESGHNEEAEGDDHGMEADDNDQENPIAATDESIAKGSQIYAASCAACHGDTGLGDGVAGASLVPPPANLHEDHVQVLSDGGMFSIIRNGVEDTAMPAFDETLDEDDIWHVVNFVRTYREN
ncbi:MAG TPA: c-type cytochrome [Caldilineae bacterium]|nr:c-type cytochrome [Caldilineae bacterium]